MGVHSLNIPERDLSEDFGVFLCQFDPWTEPFLFLLFLVFWLFWGNMLTGLTTPDEEGYAVLVEDIFVI